MVFEGIKYKAREMKMRLIDRPRLDLTTRLHVDMYETLMWAGLPFNNPEIGFGFIDPKERDRVRKYGEHVSSKIKELSKNIEGRVESDDADLSFNLDNVSALNHTYSSMENVIPSAEKIQELIDLLQQSMGNSHVGGTYERVKKMLPLSGMISGISAVGAGAIGAYGAMGLYVSSLAAAAKAHIDDKSPPWQTLWANLGIYAGFISVFADSLINHYGEDNPRNSLIRLGINGLHFLSMPLALVTFNYLKMRRAVETKIKYLKKSRSEFDGFLRHGIVLEEARRGLKTANKAIQKGNGSAEDIKTQVENLERTLKRYLDGKSSYDDVVNARIHYEIPVQASVQRTFAPAPMPATNGITKRRYSPEEHAELRRRREAEKMEQGIIRRPLNAGVVPASAEESYTEPTLTIGLSKGLQSAYRKGRLRIGGNNIVPLVDTAKSKIENNPNGGEKIKRTDEGKYLAERLLSRNGFSQDTILYKMRPTGSGIRAFYVREGDKVTILEIMAHDQYDVERRRR